MNVLETIQEALDAHISKQYHLDPAWQKKYAYTLNIDEQRQQFGDLSCNAALILAKELGQSPRAIAQAIADSFKHPLVAQVTIAGPGFLNIYVVPNVYAQLLAQMLEAREQFFKPTVFTKKQYNIEFVSANPTGPLHIGHGRGGIIGDVLGNILAFIGYQVTKEFYINDAGSQIEKLGQSFKARCYHELGMDYPLPEDGYQGVYLVDLAKICVKEYGKKLAQEPDSFFAGYAKEQLLQEQRDTLQAFGITFDTWFSELSLHESNALLPTIQRLRERGYIYDQDGAVWFKSTELGDDKDRVLRKSDGQWTYFASDMAYMLNKVQRGADHMINVLGQDHHGYVERLQAMRTALGLEDQVLDVILYQLVSLKEDGQEVRMSKRAGRIVELRDIIDTVGCDVARFFFLNRKADAHLVFDINLALKKTEENPVYYIQYAYVRIGSVLKKAAEHKEFCAITGADSAGLTEHEQLLIKKIVSLKDVLASMSQTYHTHQLAYYALELAQLFHAYYSKNKIIDLSAVAQSRARLALLMQLQRTLEITLKLLGLSQPTSM